MKAMLKNYSQPPRKVGLVATLIRGKSVAEAKRALSFLPKKSAPAIEKLIESAVANARQQGIASEDLKISKITVDKGLVMRRYRPFARGRAGSKRKVMSTVRLELSAVPQKTKKRAAKSQKSAA
jgi:large subunit ribosomal protein L22